MKSYYKDSTVRLKGVFKNGLKSDEWHEFRPDGTLWNVFNFVNDTLHGNHFAYSPNGSFLTEGRYEHGKCVGKWIFFKNYIRSEGIFDSENRKTGEWLSYYKDGSIESKKYFESNLLNGKSIFFFKSGSVKKTVVYQNGLKVGPSILYYENGSFNSKKSFDLKGKKNGDFEYYFPSGKIKNVVTWSHGSMTFLKKYYPNGTLKTIGARKDGLETGEWIFNFQNGNISSIGNYLNGLKQGQWKVYSSAGQLIKVENYDKGVLIEN